MLQIKVLLSCVGRCIQIVCTVCIKYFQYCLDILIHSEGREAILYPHDLANKLTILFFPQQIQNFDKIAPKKLLLWTFCLNSIPLTDWYQRKDKTLCYRLFKGKKAYYLIYFKKCMRFICLFNTLLTLVCISCVTLSCFDYLHRFLLC